MWCVNGPPCLENQLRPADEFPSPAKNLSPHVPQPPLFAGFHAQTNGAAQHVIYHLITEDVFIAFIDDNQLQRAVPRPVVHNGIKHPFHVFRFGSTQQFILVAPLHHQAKILGAPLKNAR